MVERRHAALLGCAFLSFLSYATTIPSLPALLSVDKYGPAYYGTVQSVGNLVGMLSSAPFGRLSDRHGRRGAVCGCFALGATGSLLLLIGGTASWLVPVAGSMLRRIDRSSSAGVLKAYAVEQEDQDPAPILARIMMSTGLGFSLGSSLGGWFSQYGASAVAATSVALSLGATAIAAVSLQGGTSHQKEQQSIAASPMPTVVPMWWKDASVRGLLLVRFAIGCGFFFIVSTFDIYCKKRFDLSPAEFGYLLSYIGLCFAFVSGFIVPSVVPRFPARHLFVGSMLVLALARLCLAAAGTIAHVLAADVLVCLGSAVCATVGSSLLAQVSAVEHIGYFMGLSESAQGLAGVITPAVAGFLFEQYGSSAPGMAAALCCVLGACIFVGMVPDASQTVRCSNRKIAGTKHNKAE